MVCHCDRRVKAAGPFPGLWRAFVGNGESAEIESAAQSTVLHDEPLGVDCSLQIWPAKQRPSGIVEWLAIHMRHAPPSEFERAPAQRLKPHRRLRIEMRFEGKSQNRAAERLHVGIFACRGHLHDRAILQMWTEQSASSSGNRAP